MNLTRNLCAGLVALGLCLGASLYAGEVAPPGDREAARPGQAEADRGPGARDGGDRRAGPEGDRNAGPRGRGEVRGRRPEGPPLLGDVKGMKEELDKHQTTMKTLQDQIAQIPGKPGEKKDGGNPEEDQARKEALQAKVDQIAPAIIDEFVRHYQAVAELLKADREGAIEKLKGHMMKPGSGRRGPGAPGEGPPRDKVDGEAPAGGEAQPNAGPGGGPPGERPHGRSGGR